jgi:nitroreductase
VDFINKEVIMDYNSLLELVKKRRSTRKFKPDAIPDEYIDKVIEVARWAPSGANSQPWEFVVVKKQELREKIVELITRNNKMMHEIEVTRAPELRFRWEPGGYARAPVLIIVCGDPRTMDAYPLSTTLERGSKHLISGLASCFLYMNLAAAVLGLGAQWVSAIAAPYVQSFTKDLLGIPVELEFYDMMALGYPDMQPKPRLVRPREEMVHYDRYDISKYRTDQQIRDFIATLRGQQQTS